MVCQGWMLTRSRCWNTLQGSLCEQPFGQRWTPSDLNVVCPSPLRPSYFGRHHSRGPCILPMPSEGETAVALLAWAGDAVCGWRRNPKRQAPNAEMPRNISYSVTCLCKNCNIINYIWYILCQGRPCRCWLLWLLRYVYPVCKHTRDVTCFQLSEYQSSPNKAPSGADGDRLWSFLWSVHWSLDFLTMCSVQVPLCEHMVEYLPVCGHSISVKCSLKPFGRRS